MEMKLALIVVVAGCASAPPPVAAPPPPPPPPQEVAQPEAQPVVIAKGGDPCDGGEVTESSRSGVVGGASSGAGAGAGEGLGRGRSDTHAIHPTVSIGQVTVDAGSEAVIVRRVLLRTRTRFLFCYEKALQQNPNLDGTVDIEFAIDISGHVAHATSHGVDGEVDRCLNTAFEALELPPPKSEATAHVTLHFNQS